MVNVPCTCRFWLYIIQTPVPNFPGEHPCSSSSTLQAIHCIRRDLCGDVAWTAVPGYFNGSDWRRWCIGEASLERWHPRSSSCDHRWVAPVRWYRWTRPCTNGAGKRTSVAT